MTHPCSKTDEPCEWELLHSKVQAKWLAALAENEKLRKALQEARETLGRAA